MTSLRSIMVAVLAAVLGGASAVALSACSDDDVLGGNAEQVEVSLTERDLRPGRVQVDAGKIEFEVRNDGNRVHAFAVDTPGGVKRSENIKPGETTSLTVELSQGRYRMYDPRGGYRERGVSGTVVVTSGDTDTVTERTVERTVIDEAPQDVPEVDDPELQEPEVQEPPPVQPTPRPAQPAPPPVTQTVTVPRTPSETSP